MLRKGKPVLGICNGAQILAEVGLVPGVFTENQNAKFICEWTELRLKLLEHHSQPCIKRMK